MTTTTTRSQSHRRRTTTPAVPVPNWYDTAFLGIAPHEAHQPKGAASQATSYLDLSGSGNPVAVGLAPTWDAVNGWKLNGTTQYLITNFVPQADQSQTVLLQFTTLTNTGTPFGVIDSAGGLHYLGLVPNSTVSNAQYANGWPVKGIATPYTSGNAAVAGNKAYRNGAPEPGTMSFGASAPVLPALIGCRSLFGSANSFAALYIQAHIIYPVALTAIQLAAVAAAMAAC